MVGLVDINEAVQNVSEAISSVLDVDVIISDAEFRKVGDTKRHFNREVTEIRDTYVIGHVLRTGETATIASKADSPQCMACKEQAECNLRAMICVPIEREGARVGAIGLIAITDVARAKLLDNRDNLVVFTNRMADLIVSKLIEQETAEKLTISKNRLTRIIDSIEEGIVAVDAAGRIMHTNAVVEEVLGARSEELAGQLVETYFSGAYVGALLRDGTAFTNIELRIGDQSRSTHVLISGKPVGEKNAGSILALKKMDDVYKVINNLTTSPLATSFDEIVGASPQIGQLKRQALRVAVSSSNILITGESGTGKELLARAIHHASPRAAKPFVALNCAAMPETLIESELFGFEEGAFTGAARGGRPGKFQLAHGGTIFLDEIGDMPLHLQPKLLRVLQEKTVERLGGHKSVAVDVRVIAATNRDLEQLVARGEFREDLYYRLSVIPLHIPPLRARVGDVRLLMTHLLRQYGGKLGKSIKGFTGNAEDALLAWPWKGNVRELANAVEYAVNMEQTPYISFESLPVRIREGAMSPAAMPAVGVLRSTETDAIRRALGECGESLEGKKRAAAMLGISLATLYRKIKEM
ncbi:sigma-54 interaction domain-containing protein [Pleomorphomonas oryzae]|uniref:sigma-54 interaction domain-containing protein n=1 Tax=Pleomorphomonas oryzae TaxID=261934 RepID=UPI00040253DF|nr:sigma 54-interacting transcriptional regulator [Pleomorphomonas oryzae]